MGSDKIGCGLTSGDEGSAWPDSTGTGHSPGAGGPCVDPGAGTVVRLAGNAPASPRLLISI